MLKELKYTELKTLAKERGVSTAGKKEDLIKRLEVTTSEAEEPVEEVSVKVESGNKTDAVVYQDGKEVRRYSIKSHGKDFKKLAEEFIKTNGGEIKYEDREGIITCPSCRHEFRT